MTKSMKDEIKGKFHEVKGSVKEKAGKVTKDADLKTEGHAEKLRGKVQKKLGQMERVLEKYIRSSLAEALEALGRVSSLLNVVAAEGGCREQNAWRHSDSAWYVRACVGWVYVYD